MYFINPTPSYKVTFANINVTFNLTYLIRKWTSISKADNISHCSYGLPTRRRGDAKFCVLTAWHWRLQPPRMWHHIEWNLLPSPLMIPLPWRRRQYFPPKLLLPIWIHGVTSSISSVPLWHFRGTRWRSWLRHCAISWKVAGSISDGFNGIFHWHDPSGRTMALGLTQLLTYMSTRNISWSVKAAGA